MAAHIKIVMQCCLDMLGERITIAEFVANLRGFADAIEKDSSICK